MDIKVGNLTITNFCIKNREHLKFRKVLVSDCLTYEFVSHAIGNDLNLINPSDTFQLGYSYIVEDNKKPVGYIYLEEMEDEEVIELRYIVHPKYRRLGYSGISDINRKGYGQQILEECGNYLLTLDNIKNVELHIRPDNEKSIGCAEKSKYKKIGVHPEYGYYIYRMNRDSEVYEN